MLREYTYIICPNGCDIRAQVKEREDGTGRICPVGDAACPKGRTCMEQEVTAPQKNIATSVSIKGDILPLASVRLTNPTLRDRTSDAIDEIKGCTLTAPVKAGTVVVSHLPRYGADVIVTKSVSENGCG